MVAVFLYPAIQDPLGNTEIQFDFPDGKSVLNSHPGGFSFGVGIMLAVTAHARTPCSR